MKTIITFAVAGLVAMLIAVLGTLTFVKWREAAQATQRASRAIEQGQAARERNRRLAVAFVTEDGGQHSEVLAMLTSWDVLKDDP